MGIIEEKSDSSLPKIIETPPTQALGTSIHSQAPDDTDGESIPPLPSRDGGALRLSRTGERGYTQRVSEDLRRVASNAITQVATHLTTRDLPEPPPPPDGGHKAVSDLPNLPHNAYTGVAKNAPRCRLKLSGLPLILRAC